MRVCFRAFPCVSCHPRYKIDLKSIEASNRKFDEMEQLRRQQGGMGPMGSPLGPLGCALFGSDHALSRPLPSCQLCSSKTAREIKRSCETSELLPVFLPWFARNLYAWAYCQLCNLCVLV